MKNIVGIQLIYTLFLLLKVTFALTLFGDLKALVSWLQTENKTS